MRPILVTFEVSKLDKSISFNFLHLKNIDFRLVIFFGNKFDKFISFNSLTIIEHTTHINNVVAVEAIKF